ncbi:MAG: AAA family ATPase [Acidobacteria bacterium]|nr:AAA family ATPase [Acidobacteriota bacterium]MBI3662249.1 AAA family ATPase [Acidobacteriota bacterium]
MIKRLRVKNFLSLRDFDIGLGQMNVLVGPNMAGKTNLIECLRFMTQICLKGLIQTFIDRGGFPEVIWKGSRSEDRISLLLEGEKQTNGDPARFSYEISIVGSPSGYFFIEFERLIAAVAEKEIVLVDLKSGQGHVNRADGTRVTDTTGSPNSSALELKVPGWEGMEFKSYLSAWHFYDLIPQVMKQANAAVLQGFLAETGENLSSWLMTLFTKHPESKERIKQVIADALPELVEFLTPPTQFSTTHLIAREKNLKDVVNIWRMAHGELVFLAFLSLIFAPDELGAPLYCVEEPENHLHPRLLDTLVQVQGQVAKELGPNAAQIIVTTHSPHLVDKVNLEDLIVMERRNGETTWSRPSSRQNLRDMLAREQVGLGELWYSGALGGL